MSPIIRPFREADHAEVMELWCRAWEATVPGLDFRAQWPVILAQWDALLADGGRAFVADDHPLIRGFVVLGRDSDRLDQIALAPEAFGSGLGSQLIGFAKAQAVESLALTVNSFNRRAIRFYERQGFLRTGESVDEPSGLPVLHYVWWRSHHSGKLRHR